YKLHEDISRVASHRLIRRGRCAAMSHEWTAPAVQEECDYQGSVRAQPCIRAYECRRFEKCTHKRSGTRPSPDAASLKDGRSLFLRYDGFEIGLLTVGTVTAGHRRASDAELL